MTTKRLGGWILAAFLAVAIWHGPTGSDDAEAQHLRPHHHFGWVAGVPVGYGWIPWFATPVVVPYGYSYYSYRSYQPRYASFGAISYSWAEDRVGVAWGAASRRGAFRNSQNYCATEDCRPVVWVQGGCAAVAVSRDAEKLTYAYNTTRFGASRAAMQACRRGGIEGCEAKAWVCSR